MLAVPDSNSMDTRTNHLLAAALSTGDIGEDLTDGDVQALLAATAREGVSALLESRLRAGAGWGELPNTLQAELVSRTRIAAVQDMARQQELRRVAETLANAGIKTLLLKGNALGLWLYPQPYLRMVSDIDLLFASEAELERGLHVLSTLGYSSKSRARPYQFERTTTRNIPGIGRCELDLHSRLLNAPVFADVLPFAALWAQSVQLPSLPEGVRVLGHAHALLHASLNRALDMQFGVPDTLRLLYDAHLLALQMPEDGWQHLLEDAVSRGLCGVVHAMLKTATAVLLTPVPAGVLDALQVQTSKEAIDASRLSNWRYMQRMNLRALPSMQARLRWLWLRLLPDRESLGKLHGDGPLLMLLMRRIAKGLVRL